MHGPILLPVGIFCIYIYTQLQYSLTVLPSSITQERQRDRGWAILKGFGLDEKRNFRHLFSFLFLPFSEVMEGERRHCSLVEREHTL